MCDWVKAFTYAFSGIENGKDSEVVNSTTVRSNQRVKSPNIDNWDPDVRLLQSSDKWIAVSISY